MRFIVRPSIVLVVFWFNAAAAQEGYLGHDHDKWHRGFYQTLLRPDTKTPCCNLTDCRPTSGKRVNDHYEVKVNGAWVSVPPDKTLRQSAPDLGFHVCAPFKFNGQPDHLYCVVVPPEIWGSRLNRAAACAASARQLRDKPLRTDSITGRARRRALLIRRP